MYIVTKSQSAVMIKINLPSHEIARNIYCALTYI